MVIAVFWREVLINALAKFLFEFENENFQDFYGQGFHDWRQVDVWVVEKDQGDWELWTMLHDVVTRVWGHLCKPITECELCTGVIVEIFWIHLSVLVAHHFSDLHYCEKMIGKVLWVLIVYCVIKVVNRFLTKLPVFICFFVFSWLRCRVNLGVICRFWFFLYRLILVNLLWGILFWGSASWMSGLTCRSLLSFTLRRSAWPWVYWLLASCERQRVVALRI